MTSCESDDDCTQKKNYLIKPKKLYKVHIAAKYHHKNDFSLRQSINILNWTLTDFDEAEIIFSPDVYIDISTYPNKKFIFGPHFGGFPDNIVHQFNNNVHNNAIYIIPSEQFIISIVDEFKYTNLPMKLYSFGVDTEKFKPTYNSTKKKVFLYFKNRDPNELQFLTNFLTKNNIEFTIFKYGSYNEQEYLNTLNECKYGIWLGCHESQGFALEEALSMNVPLLVWSVTLMSQEYSMHDYYKNVKTKITTIPYWDNRCGEYFYDKNELEGSFQKFLNNLDLYNPREFILDNLTIEKRTDALEKLINF